MRGYWIPAKDVEANADLRALRDLVSETPACPIKPHKRGRFDVSFYTSWAAFNPGGEIKVSADFRENGKEGERFVKATKSLWEEASAFMRDICPGQFHELRKARLPLGMKRHAGVWSGFRGE